MWLSISMCGGWLAYLDPRPLQCGPQRPTMPRHQTVPPRCDHPSIPSVNRIGVRPCNEVLGADARRLAAYHQRKPTVMITPLAWIEPMQTLGQISSSPTPTTTTHGHNHGRVPLTEGPRHHCLKHFRQHRLGRRRERVPNNKSTVAKHLAASPLHEGYGRRGLKEVMMLATARGPHDRMRWHRAKRCELRDAILALTMTIAIDYDPALALQRNPGHRQRPVEPPLLNQRGIAGCGLGPLHDVGDFAPTIALTLESYGEDWDPTLRKGQREIEALTHRPSPTG